MLFHPPKGVIALDIDGTVTAESHELETEVIQALHRLTQDEWQLIFITGRPFQWGFLTLKPLPFSYALAVQNGALLLEMPSQNILLRKYLSHKIIPQVEQIGQEYETDFIIYSGLENEDRCYYRENFLPSSILSYGLHRAESLGEKWEPLQTFSDLPVSKFSSIKFFTHDERAFLLSKKIEKELGLHAPPNRDPFNRDYFVIQVTHAEATKGQILKDFMQLTGMPGPVIAAGDDHNDRSMLTVAHLKIVMANAPEDLLAIADVIAPPASEQGIIQGLTEAIHRLKPQQGETYV
jgi:Cof subfamily protein (haloacid dehalogenase superfamily)